MSVYSIHSIYLVRGSLRNAEPVFNWIIDLEVICNHRGLWVLESWQLEKRYIFLMWNVLIMAQKETCSAWMFPESSLLNPEAWVDVGWACSCMSPFSSPLWPQNISELLFFQGQHVWTIDFPGSPCPSPPNLKGGPQALPLNPKSPCPSPQKGGPQAPPLNPKSPCPTQASPLHPKYPCPSPQNPKRLCF